MLHVEEHTECLELAMWVVNSPAGTSYLSSEQGGLYLPACGWESYASLQHSGPCQFLAVLWDGITSMARDLPGASRELLRLCIHSAASSCALCPLRSP